VQWQLRSGQSVADRPKAVNACTELIATKRPLAACGKLTPTSPLRGGRDEGNGLPSTTAGLLGTGQRQSGEMTWSTTSYDARCFHSRAADSSLRTSHLLVAAVGALVLTRPVQSNQRTLPAVLRTCVVALSRAVVAGITCRNYRCRAVRHSSKGRWESVAFALSHGHTGDTNQFGGSRPTAVIRYAQMVAAKRGRSRLALSVSQGRTR
jgi:hypothetical protein